MDLGPGGLAGRAEPRAPAGDARLRDRRAAPVARLPGAAVDLELVLHRARSPVGRHVVAKGRPLPSEPRLERLANATMDPSHLVERQLAGRLDELAA